MGPVRSPRRRARAATAVGVVAVVLVMAGGVTAYAATRDDAPSYRTVAVGTQSVQQVLQSTGTVEAGSAATVSFAVSGTVSAVTVAVGSTVKAGQVLATLDTASLTSAYATAQAEAADAALTLEQAESGELSSVSGGGSGSGGTSGSSSSGSTGSTAATTTAFTTTAFTTMAFTTTAGTSTSSVAAAQRALVAAVRAADQALATTKKDLALASKLCVAATPTPTPSATSTARLDRRLDGECLTEPFGVSHRQRDGEHDRAHPRGAGCREDADDVRRGPGPGPRRRDQGVRTPAGRLPADRCTGHASCRCLLVERKLGRRSAGRQHGKRWQYGKRLDGDPPPAVPPARRR